MPFKPLPAVSITDSKIDDLSGLNCLILGDHDGLGNDLAIYLKSAGAIVEQISDLSSVQQLIQNLVPGLWLVVIDAGQETPSIEELRTAFATRSNVLKSSVQAESNALQSDIAPHFIIIKRGRRRHARIEDIDIVTLDGDVLYRQSLLRAMAIAAGRVEVGEEKEPLADVLKSEPVVISREEALQQGKLILVAEDNEINQKVIRQQLNLLGYAADIASDGREALQRLQVSNYALLLTDLHMPEMDGFELTKNIRLQEAGHKYKHIPIVALTANALKGEREHCLNTGMDDYLTKPAQLEDLRSVLEKYLSSSKPIVDTASATQLLTSVHEVESVMVPVDVHVLEKLVGNDLEMIKEMLQDYRASAEKTATELRAAYQAGQWATVGALAHKLKSSSRSVGALVLGELCAKMEQAGKSNDAKALAVLLPSFDAEIIKVETYLDSLYEKDA